MPRRLGGPLFASNPRQHTLVGLVSRASGGSRMCGSSASYTRVAPYADWIDQVSRDRDPGCAASGGAGTIWPALGLDGGERARERRQRGGRSLRIGQPVLEPLAVVTGLEFQSFEHIHVAAADTARGYVEVRFTRQQSAGL
jgi:hypothetical protein